LSARASSLFGYMFIRVAHCQQDMEAMDGNTRPNREAIKRVREMLEQMRSELLNITREFPIRPLGDSPSAAPGRQVRLREEFEEVEDSGEDSDEKQKVRKTRRPGQG
jgi:predicted  nucleic acid-binding Zn-ribbon protein